MTLTPNPSPSPSLGPNPSPRSNPYPINQAALKDALFVQYFHHGRSVSERQVLLDRYIL